MFKRRILCLSLVLALFASSAPALTPAQLVTPFYGDDEHVDLEFKNLSALRTGKVTPLQQMFGSRPAELDDPLFASVQRQMENMAFRCVLSGAVKKDITDFIFAVELSSPLPPASRGESFFLPGQPPEGTELRPWCKKVDDDFGTLYMAQMARGDRHFLLGASDSDVLAVMAAVPESTQTVPHRLDAPHFWFGVYTPKTDSTDSGVSDLLPQSYTGEGTLWDTDRSLRMTLWADMGADLQSDGREESPSATPPLLLGSGPLLGLLSLENVVPPSMREKIVAQCRDWLNANELDSDDLRDVLKGRVTLGIAGTTSTLVGSFPGVYLHLSGANRRVCTALLNAATELLSTQAKTGTESFSQGVWEGFRTGRWSLFSAYGCVGDGVLLALQNSSELTKTPVLHDDMKVALKKPSPVMLNVDLEHLADALSDLLYRFGGLLLDSEDRSMAEKFIKAMKAFTVLNVTSESSSGTADVELFVKQPEYRRLFALDDPAENGAH